MEALIFIGIAMLLFVTILVFTSSKSTEIIGGFIVAALAIGMVGVVFLYGIFSWGYVSFHFYDWFVLRYYPTLPHFTIIQFIGFGFVISTFIRLTGNSDIKDEYKEKKSTRWIMGFLNPWFTLLLGYLFLIWFVV